MTTGSASYLTYARVLFQCLLLWCLPVVGLVRVRNDKNSTNLSLVFFLVDKKVKKNELNFLSQFHGHLETPGDVQLTPFISTGLFFYF